MARSFPYDIYRGVIILAPSDWDSGAIPSPEHRRQGFFPQDRAIELYTPHADDTVRVTVSVTDDYPTPAADALRAIRAPIEVGDDLMLCNIDNEDDLPIRDIPPGRYGLQFELRPGGEHDGKAFYYDIALTFVRDADPPFEILKSGHEGMTATEVLRRD
jgi:hypothetical protein